MNEQKEIKFEDVLSVYSGRPGCCCGCRGKHTYRKATQEIGSKNRGYIVTDDECNDKTIKMIVNKMNKMIKAGIEADYTSYDDVFSNNVAIELENRLYIAYLLPKNK